MVKLRLKKMAYSKQLFIMLLLACSTLLLVVFKTSAAHTGSISDPLPIDNEDDLYKMAECMKYNKSWSNGKHFSLNCDIELKTSIELSNSAEGYMFCGKFHGNGHTLTLSGGTPLFSTITPFTNLTSFAAHTGSASDPLPINSEDDLYRMAELTCTVKDGSNGKHFSLNKDIKITLQTNICNQSHPFCGHFHGNGHTIRLLSNRTLFDYIGKEGIIENLTIEGKGRCANTNYGTIRHCIAVPIDISNGIVENNYGKIEDCQVKGLFKEAGITNQNYGEITRCVIAGSEDEFGSYGITACNNKGGKITHCRVSATIRSGSSSSYGVSYTAGLVGINSGLIENCTMDGKILGGGYGVYLVGQSSQDTSEAMIRKSVAGKDASGAYCQKLFGSYSGQVEDCGYEGWDKDDYCSVK